MIGTSIEVSKKKSGIFLAIVSEVHSGTEHTVELDDEYYRKLTAGRISAEELIEKSFYFLLKRESSKSILSRFNLKIIQRYFPEYEQEIMEEHDGN